MLNRNKNLKKIISNIPNILTISRLFLTFPLIIFLEINLPYFVLGIIVLGGITDYFDGYFARKLNLKTKFGAIIDPLTDKIFLLIPLLWLSKIDVIPFWSLAIILFRELIISALRSSNKDGLPASQLGKYKTSFFFYCISYVFPTVFNIFIIYFRSNILLARIYFDAYKFYRLSTS